MSPNTIVPSEWARHPSMRALKHDHAHRIQHHKRHHHQQNHHHHHIQQWTSRCKDGVTEVAYFSHDWQCWVRYGSWFCVRAECPFLLGHHSYELTRSRKSSFQDHSGITFCMEFQIIVTMPKYISYYRLTPKYDIYIEIRCSLK